MNLASWLIVVHREFSPDVLALVTRESYQDALTAAFFTESRGCDSELYVRSSSGDYVLIERTVRYQA